MGLPEDMVYWFVGLLLLLIDGMLGSWSWGEDFERNRRKTREAAGLKSHLPGWRAIYFALLLILDLIIIRFILSALPQSINPPLLHSQSCRAKICRSSR